MCCGGLCLEMVGLNNWQLGLKERKSVLEGWRVRLRERGALVEYPRRVVFKVKQAQ